MTHIKLDITLGPVFVLNKAEAKLEDRAEDRDWDRAGDRAKDKAKISFRFDSDRH